MNLGVRLTLLSSIGVLAACGGRTDSADAAETVFVRAVQQLEQPDCVAKADPTVAFRDRGSLDAALSSRYKVWFLVGNRAPYDAHDDGATIAEISGADVKLFDLSLPTHDPVATYYVCYGCSVTFPPDGRRSHGASVSELHARGDVVVAHDCCSDSDPDVHDILVKKVFVRAGAVATCEEIVEALGH